MPQDSLVEKCLGIRHCYSCFHRWWINLWRAHTGSGDPTAFHRPQWRDPTSSAVWLKNCVNSLSAWVFPAFKVITMSRFLISFSQSSSQTKMPKCHSCRQGFGMMFFGDSDEKRCWRGRQNSQGGAANGQKSINWGSCSSPGCWKVGSWSTIKQLLLLLPQRQLSVRLSFLLRKCSQTLEIASPVCPSTRHVGLISSALGWTLATRRSWRDVSGAGEPEKEKE